MKRLLLAVAAVLFIAAAPAAVPANAANFTIVPGKSFGDIKPNMTLADLKRIYGAENVSVGMLQPPHGDFPEQRGARIFADSPSEVEVFFREGTDTIQWVIVGRLDSVWKTVDGIHTGMGLAALQESLGQPFEISPFGRDGGGSIIDAHNRDELKDLIIRLSYPENLSAADGAAIEGEKPFRSDSPAARRAGLKVIIIWWDLGE